MSTTSVIVHSDAEVLAHAVAARMLVRIIDAQAERGSATVVLTGGRISVQVYQAVWECPARAAVDWSRVDFWWGDERFLPTGHPDRNETQARAALLDALAVDPARIHPMPASDGPDGPDPEAAAARYREVLAAAARPGDSVPVPPVDVLLLGIGEDGHVASIFPDRPAVDDDRPATAVRDSPKPPPVRVTLTRSAINTADEVWLIVAGASKASAVGTALRGVDPVRLPAAEVHGVARTVWLLDRAAAAEIPPRLPDRRPR